MPVVVEMALTLPVPRRLAPGAICTPEDAEMSPVTLSVPALQRRRAGVAAGGAQSQVASPGFGHRLSAADGAAVG